MEVLERVVIKKENGHGEEDAFERAEKRMAQVEAVINTQSHKVECLVDSMTSKLSSLNEVLN